MKHIDEVWYGSGAFASVARAALTPVSWLYAAGARIDAWQQARGRLEAALPALSIGNVSVGGTGKTPMAAWAAAALRARGGLPAIVMRGYGDDEPLVHRQLNPDVSVIVDADRARGVIRARAGGADCVILDDAFQHRRIARTADWVLVAAEQWRRGQQVLPAGPLRERWTALARADVVIVTRKSATSEQGDVVLRALEQYVAADRIATCRFDLVELRQLARPDVMTLDAIAGQRILAIAAVGAPGAFFAQLRAAGADVHEAAFADHHAFTASDIARLAREAARADAAVCTLKDAVKLAAQWPPAALPLWYVSQRPVIERGHAVLDRGLEMVLAARHVISSTAGSAGPSSSPHGHRSSTAD